MTVGSAIPRFICTVAISETLEEFGNSPTVGDLKAITFSNKKNAKKFAAKKAVDWLIANERMPNNGDVKFPKVPTLPPVAKTKSRAPLSSQDSEDNQDNVAAQVPQLCYQLGFNVPRYNLTQAAPNSPLYDIYADFGDDPLIEGKVGEIQNVFGKKNAKEQCARRVFSFLKDIQRQRLE
jgi:hypothetical protein